MPRPLLLLPGLLCDAALWQHQLRHLTGLAAMQVTDPAPHDSIAAMAEAALAAAPERFALAGLSMGGHVAHEIMRRAPERVTHLALIDTSARADTADAQARRRAMMEMAELGRFKGVTPRLLPALIRPDRLGDAALTGTISAMAERIGKDAFIRNQKALMNRIDGRPALAEYRCPTLVMVGRDDAITPPELSAEMAGLIPGAALVTIERSGHLPTLEQPEAATAVLAYWLQR